MFSLGIELEMAVIDQEDGSLHLVGEYFKNLKKIRRRRGVAAGIEKIGKRDIGVISPGLISSVDNGFNNLESAIGPLLEGEAKLQQLSDLVERELLEVVEALALEGAGLLNFAEHPSQTISEEYYRQARSPKPIYDYWVEYRNWNHQAGIDAKAHNGPTSGISWGRAVEGLNVLLGFSAVFIALFGNSPFAEGRRCRCKENRQTLWPQMFADARFPCDRRLQVIPDRPFRDLRDYLVWMFGPTTRMQVIPGTNRGSYKTSSELVRVVGDPALLDFLQGGQQQVISLCDGSRFLVNPSMRHLEFLQFSQFLDCRIRFASGERQMDLEAFLVAMETGRPLEEIFEVGCSSVYLEGRGAGANFPDREICDWGDEEVARSVVISVAALQNGVLRDLGGASRLLRRYAWTDLLGLRQAAIEDGIQGEYGEHTVATLCQEVLELASSSLSPAELWMVAYPMRVLRDGANGADRALRRYEKMGGHPEERLQKLILERKVVLPFA